VIGPDVSLSKGVEVLLATASGTVLLVTHEHVKDLVLRTHDEDMLRNVATDFARARLQSIGYFSC
jgi:hypothetical protein